MTEFKKLSADFDELRQQFSSLSGVVPEDSQAYIERYEAAERLATDLNGMETVRAPACPA